MARKKLPDLAKLDDEELAALSAELAEERTAVRLDQVAVSNEQTFRAALTSLSPSQKEALQVRMGGKLPVESASTSEKVQ